MQTRRGPMDQDDWDRTIAKALVAQMHLHAEKRNEDGRRRSPARGERRERAVWCPVQRNNATKRDHGDDQNNQHAGDHLGRRSMSTSRSELQAAFDQWHEHWPHKSYHGGQVGGVPLSRARDVRSWHLADITMAFGDVRFLGVKRTFGNSAAMSANDPKRTSAALTRPT